MTGGSPASAASGDSALTVACRSLGLLLAEAASVGLAAWYLRSWARLEGYVSANSLPPRARRFVFVNMAGAAGLVLVCAAVVLVWRRINGVQLLHRISHRAAPLILTAFLPLLFHWELWMGRELTFLVLASMIVLALQGLMRLALSTPPVLRGRWWPPAPAHVLRAKLRPLAHAGWLPLLLVVVAAAGYALYFSIHTINHHFNLGTAAFDLGIENNLVWNAIHGGPLFKTSPLGGPTSTHLGYHQTYFAYVIGLVYVFAPRPETLLVVQAVLLGAAAIPLYFLAGRRLGPWPACLVAILYLLYPPLHGSNLYDFHYLPLAPLFLWLTLYLLETRRDRWAAVALILSLSLREDISALLVVLGGYLVLTGERPRAGLLVAALGGAYFVVLKMIIMPRFLAGHASYIHQYQALLPEGDSGYGGVLKTVFGNPGFTLTHLLERDKIYYLLQIIAPLAFLPWRRPVGLLCSVPGFFFTLLSTGYPPTIQISFQYTAYWTSFLFIAIIANLHWLTRGPVAEPDGAVVRRRAWLVALTAATLLTSYQFGAILQRNTVRGGFGPYRFGVTDTDRARHADLYGLIAMVPPRAKIVGTEMVVPHVSSRPDAYTLRTGIWDAEYILVQMPPSADETAHFAEALKSGRYGILAEKGTFVLAKLGHDTSRNRAVLTTLGH